MAVPCVAPRALPSVVTGASRRLVKQVGGVATHTGVAARLGAPQRARVSQQKARLRAQASGAAAATPLPGAAASESSSVVPRASGPPSRNVVALVVLAALASVAVYNYVPGMNQAVVDALAKSGFTAAFGLIFVSEIGDKTFFIAALLAMRRGRAVVLAGAVAALALMTGISVALGRLFTRLPDSFSSSLPLGEYCAVALLLFFGIKTLKDALAIEPAAEGSKGDDEMEEAAAVVSKADAEASARGILGGFVQTFSLIFVAEWGDRSMLATIALGAAQNPVGVFAGAVMGHALATLIAVVGGSLMAERISERTVGITGGTLFLLFAVATLFDVF